MILITGDTHCPHDMQKLNTTNFPQQKNLTKKDFLIICGDFGMVWWPKFVKNYKEDLYWQNWLREKNFTTLFVDGNHENHAMLTELPIIDMFGGKVGKVCDSIYHLKRGEIYTIEGKKFFCFGGARSHDKHLRREGISWWSEEMPSMNEMNYGIDNLKKYDNSVDYIITHCCGSDMQAKISPYYETDSLTQYFKFLGSEVEFKHWYFGHYHDDIEIDDKHTCLFNKIVEIK